MIQAGALTLSKAVVLSNLSMSVDDEGKEHMVDADSIFAFQSILQANKQIRRSVPRSLSVPHVTLLCRDPMPHIVCELVNAHNISFLMSSDESHSGEHKSTSDSLLAAPFTAGNVYVPSGNHAPLSLSCLLSSRRHAPVLDMLACQAYYNQHLLTILQAPPLLVSFFVAHFIPNI